MQSNVKKLFLTTAITLFLSAGLTSAAEALQHQLNPDLDAIETVDVRDFQAVPPCHTGDN